MTANGRTCQARSRYGRCLNQVTGKNLLCLKCQQAAIRYVAQLEKRIERMTDDLQEHA